LIDHLPDTAVLIYDSHLVLEMVAGPGARKWRYAERNITPGWRLDEVTPPDVLAVLEPHYQSALDGVAGTLDFHSVRAGLDFKIDAIPMADAEGRVRHILVKVTDVTTERAAEEALRFAEQRYRTAFEAAPVGMAQVNLTGHFESVNRALCELVGYTAEELCGMRYESIVHPDAHARIIDTLQTMIDVETPTWSSEGRLLHADGSIVWVAQSTLVVRDSEGQPSHYLAHYRDITDRKHYDSQLQHLAEHDPLTGLQNRRRFEVELDHQATSIVRNGPTAALLALDLDNFKHINDTLGHAAGDKLIVALAEVLRGQLRSTDVIARLGGDEFAVILPNTTPVQARLVAEGLLAAIRQQCTELSEGVPRSLTTSIGIAFFDRPGLVGADVMIEADLTMFAAKEAGGDQYAVHQSDARAQRRQARVPYISDPGVVST
jgi:diguanylate cyclase (GGDEF)-like protein/PAS domain S-box-containing protein